MITSYFYNKAEDTVKDFPTYDAREAYISNLPVVEGYRFNTEVFDDYLEKESTVFYNVFVEDNEGYSLGFVTSLEIKQTETGIIASFGNFESLPKWVNTRHFYSNLNDCLKEYIKEVMK